MTIHSKYKRVLFILALLLVLQGCKAERAEDKDAAAEHLTVVLWDYSQNQYDQHLISAFEESNPGIDIDVISFPADYYDDRMLALMSGNESVDVVYQRSSVTAGTLFREGKLMDLSGEVPDSGSMAAEPSLYEDYTFSDELTAIPYRLDQYVLIYNKTLFQQTGIEPPRSGITWNAYLALADQLQKKLPEGCYASLTLPMETQWLLSGKTAKGHIIDDPESIRPISELLLTMQKNGMTPGYGTCVEKNISQRQFETGKYAMYIGGSWYLHFLNSDAKNGLPGFQWGVVPQPVWDGMQADEASIITTGMSVSKETDHEEAALKFLHFCTGSAGAAIMAEEQMISPFMDENARRIYLLNFQGDLFSEDILDRRKGFRLDFKTPESVSRFHDFCDVFYRIETEEMEVQEGIDILKQTPNGPDSRGIAPVPRKSE